MMLDLLPKLLPQAKYLPNLALDVAYSLSPSFYYGPADTYLSDLYEKSIALPMPTFTHNRRVYGQAVEGQQEQMVAYYQEVFHLMQHYGKQLPSCEQYFCLRPVLLSAGEPCFTFPWYDTYPEAAAVLRALQDPLPEGILLNDMDQGWESIIYAQGNRLYLAEGDGEQGEPYEFAYTDRARLASLAADTLTRTQQQLSLFVRATGQNPWRLSSEL